MTQYADILDVKNWYLKAWVGDFTNFMVVRFQDDYDFVIFSTGEKNTRLLYDMYKKTEDFEVLDVYSTSLTYDEQIYNTSCLNF